MPRDTVMLDDIIFTAQDAGDNKVSPHLNGRILATPSTLTSLCISINMMFWVSLVSWSERHDNSWCEYSECVMVCECVMVESVRYCNPEWRAWVLLAVVRWYTVMYTNTFLPHPHTQQANHCYSGTVCIQLYSFTHNSRNSHPFHGCRRNLWHL